jgi:hypothetical protein
MATPMPPRRTSPAWLALVAIAAALAFGSEAHAAPARMRVQPVSSGVVVRVFVRPARAVSFTLAGRRVALRKGPPYRVFVRGHRRASASTAHAVLLVARNARNGRLLGRVRLSPERRSPEPASPIPDKARRPDPPPPPPPPPAAPAPERRAAAPIPPSPYSTPPGAVFVSTSAGLARALEADSPTDIVLADGVYDHSGPFWNTGGHRVYAASLGRAVLRAGFVLGHNWSPGNGLLRGLAFDVAEPAKTLHGDIVHVWGSGAGSRLLDLTLDGHKAVESGIKVREPDGVVIQRVVARNFTDWGVNVDANDVNRKVLRPPLVEDVVATDVTRPVPQSSGGTSEACLWIGNPAVVRRVYAARCAWEGLWTGTAARGALFEDVRVVESETGVYAEHYNSAGTTFRRLDVGPSVKRGVNCEWSDPAWDSIAGCIDVVIEDSLFDTTRIGVYMDEGTTRTTIRRSVFRNQDWAAIADHKGVANAYYDNDYSGVRAGAATVTTEHLFTHWP